MNRTRRSLLTLTVLSSSLSEVALAQGSVKVEHAWARPTAAGQAGGGGFVTLTAVSSADRLISASASVSKSVELQTMEMDGNIMRMRQVEAIDLPLGKTVELKPGGMHIMFIGLNQSLKNGSSFPLTLRFEKAGEVVVNVKVMTGATMGSGAHKH